MKIIIPAVFFVPINCFGQDVKIHPVLKYPPDKEEMNDNMSEHLWEDSLHDRRYYDSLGKHWMIEYSYKEFTIGDTAKGYGGEITIGKNDYHEHFPAYISIIEYSGRNKQKEVWSGPGIYSEKECPADYPALWIIRYFQSLIKK